MNDNNTEEYYFLLWHPKENDDSVPDTQENNSAKPYNGAQCTLTLCSLGKSYSRSS